MRCHVSLTYSHNGLRGCDVLKVWRFWVPFYHGGIILLSPFFSCERNHSFHLLSFIPFRVHFRSDNSVFSLETNIVNYTEQTLLLRALVISQIDCLQLQFEFTSTRRLFWRKNYNQETNWKDTPTKWKYNVNENMYMAVNIQCHKAMLSQYVTHIE